jgi:molybdate transport system substrate-binding protein
MLRLRLVPGVIAVALLCAAPACATRPSSEVLVFAAASLKTALDALVVPAEEATGLRFSVSYAATSTLARQIEEGAPADLFISADVEWMDYVEARDLIRIDTQVILLANRLVLIAPRDEAVPLDIGPGFAVADALGPSRLALADPSAVPAGKYARAALASLGVWDAISTQLAPAENVRAALLLVSRGEAPLGIVYRTDAQADPGVVIIDTFPESTHPPIVYPAALTRAATGDAERLLDFLSSAAARTTFEAQGFIVVGRPSL